MTAACVCGHGYNPQKQNTLTLCDSPYESKHRTLPTQENNQRISPISAAWSSELFNQLHSTICDAQYAELSTKNGKALLMHV